MNAFEYSDLLQPLLLGAANLFFAGVLHRTIVRNSTLLRRRHFFESLAVIAFVIALILTATGFALWRENPRFVLVFTGGWVMICLVAAGVLRQRNRHSDDELAMPDLWPNSPERSSEAHVEGQEHGDPTLPRPSDATRGHAVPFDAFTRARLKKARRERSTGDGRFRKNRSVYVEEESARHDRQDRDGH